MKRDAMLNLRIPTEIKAALQRAADDNFRTASSMATWALAEWLKEHRYLSATKAKAAAAQRSPAKRG